VLTVVTALLICAGCGGRELESGPLLGTWTYSATSGDIRAIAVTFNGDGTAEEVLTLGNPHSPDTCSGAPRLSGYSWTATATALTLTGSPTCSGTITCTVGRIPDGACTFPMYELLGAGLDPNAAVVVTQVAGACQYTLSSDGKTLTLDHCTQTIELPPSPVPRVHDTLQTDQLASYKLTRSS
jgi:hypothetical protein